MIGTHISLPTARAVAIYEALCAYAERIKADEVAVAVATSCADHTKGETGYCTFHARVPWGTKLFAHPPAQAAQVDKPPRLGGCCCGEPCTLGVVHRTDGPCFRYADPAAHPTTNSPETDNKLVGGVVVQDEADADVLQRLGDNASKWAAEFRATALRLGYSDMDEEWLISWFANAIEHSGDVRRWRKEAAQPRAVPDGWALVPREALIYVTDLLAERKHGPSARSPAHNARRVVEYWLTAALQEKAS